MLHATKSDPPEALRRSVRALLNQLPADTLDLGTVQVVTMDSLLPKFSTERVMGRGHLEALSGSVDDLGDVSNAELFTEVARARTSCSHYSKRICRPANDGP